MKKFEQLKRQYRSLSGYIDLTDLSDKNISATTADFDHLFELSMSKIEACYLPQVNRLIALLAQQIPEEPWEDTQIPAGLLDYAHRSGRPIYLVIEDIRKKYNCNSNVQAYGKWEEYQEAMRVISRDGDIP